MAKNDLRKPKRQPTNPNEAIASRSALFIAKTGMGKTFAVANCGIISKKDRVIVYDSAKSHIADYYDKLPDFLRALANALKKGGGFRVGYSGIRTKNIFNEICCAVWSIGDGKKPTFLLVEEGGRACGSRVEEGGALDLICQEGRKYNIHWVMTTQRPQAVPKELYDAASVWYIGQLQGRALEYVADDTRIDKEAISGLNLGEWLPFVEGESQWIKPVKFKKKGR